MKKVDIKVGGLYTARVSGRFVTVRVDAIRERMGFKREETVYDVTNLSTGRKTTFRSAAKFRSEVSPTPPASEPAPSAESPEDAPPTPLEPPGHRGPHDEGEAKELGISPPEGEQCADPTNAFIVEPTVAESHVQTAEETQEAPVQSVESNTATAPAPTTVLTSLAAQIAAMPSAPTLTPEQEEGIRAALEVEATKGNGQRVLLLKAGAGCGKTFELKQLEDRLHGNGQYTAFNSSLVAESKGKFRRAACNTTHSLAFRAVGKKFAHRLNGPRVRSYEIAARLGIKDFSVALPLSLSKPGSCPECKGLPVENECPTCKGSGKVPTIRTLKASYLAGQVIAAIRKFCQSDEPEITARSFRTFEGIDEEGKRDNSDRVREYLLPFAQAAWDDLSREDGRLPFSHDVYVKLWELGRGADRPVIAADYILLDEAQDTAPVMLSILRQQTHALLILVGDDNQQIYEWRGAVNAMASFKDARTSMLSQSFRFGQAVADVANAVLDTLEEPTELVMKGTPSIPSRICPVASPRCYLYRTNAGAIAMLMRAKAEGKRGHLIGGSKEVVEFCKAALDLQAGRGTQHPELGCFEKWEEVQAYSKEDEGADLRLMVKLIDEFGADEIATALDNMPPEDRADLVLSTAHRSKGREWSSVRLGADFPTANKMTDADRRLLYVAVTRAQEELDITQCPTFCGGYDKRGGEDGSGEARWIPGIDICYTAPMPTEADLASYRAGKRTERPANASGGNKAIALASPRPDAVQANVGNGNGNGAEFTWANMDGQWLVRGPAGQEGKRVTVTRKNGTKSQEMLRSVAKRIGDVCFYSVR